MIEVVDLGAGAYGAVAAESTARCMAWGGQVASGGRVA